MTIRQLKYIGSIGRFRSCAAEGDVTFKKYTLIFGENGRGKTTLCSILRSLQTDNPDFIIGRKTLGTAKDPSVVLSLAHGTAVFKDGRWNGTPPKLRIFDAQYVADNVYIGDAIDTEQRRNLCNVILGTDGVGLANEYHEFDLAISAKNTAIRDVRRILTTHVDANQLDQFIALPKDPEIENKIEDKRKEVEGLRDINNLRSQPMLEKIETPPLPTRLEDILRGTLEDVSRDAGAAVQQHLKAHGMQGKEEWLSTGLAHLADGDCPFCGQDIDGISLIRAYQSYFNDNYIKFRQELTSYQLLPAKYYSDDRIKLMLARIEANAVAIEVWQRYIRLDVPSLAKEIDPAGITRALRTEMLALLEKKAATPLDPIAASADYKDAYDAMAKLADAVQQYNTRVDTTNERISSFKNGANPAGLQSANNELRWLELTKKRHEPSIAELCASYNKLNEEKEYLEKGKREARARLDAYGTDVCSKYSKAINRLLKRFNAGFHLDRVRVEYTGRIENSTFCVVINDTPVEMGSSDTPLNQPSFKNTLSAGDKSTLALAFFLAELEAAVDKANCIAVFDDPFNSQDHFRRTCTATEIRRCGQAVSQVVVMSHDRNFLRLLWDLPLPTGDRKALWLIPCGHKDTLIAEWSIENDTETEDAANRRILLSFYHKNEGQARDVIQKLRPVLETHMQRMAPQLLGGVKGLGNMLSKVRDAGSPSILLETYDNIDDINTYTRRYMHGEGPNPDGEPVNTTELLGMLGKVLEIAGALTEGK